MKQQSTNGQHDDLFFCVEKRCGDFWQERGRCALDHEIRFFFQLSNVQNLDRVRQCADKLLGFVMIFSRNRGQLYARHTAFSQGRRNRFSNRA